MLIVTPSAWLEKQIKESFLNSYDTKIIYNGIDLNIFKPVQSQFRSNYCLENKFVVLGVSYGWSYRKGVDVFARLARELPDNFKIVMVGVREEDDKLIPDNVIKIRKTFDQNELAEIYSSSDLFINPTREDNFPTVNIESLACGTPVLTFNTGGSPEALDKTCGDVVEKNNYEKLKKRIVEICQNNEYSRENCRKRALLFNMDNKFQEYVQLYKEKLG